MTGLIADMRVLQNIVNEFYFYRKLVSPDQSLSDDNLFSLVLCKNMFPDEFELLQQNSGNISSAFDTLKIKKEVVECKKAIIRECEEKIEKVQNAIKFTEVEYEALIRWKLQTITSQYPGLRGWKFGQETINNSDYDSVLVSLREGLELKLSNYSALVSLAENNEYLEIQNYLEKLKMLDEPNEKVEQLSRKINEISILISKVESASLKEMCSLFDDEREKLTGYKSDHIIHYLLREGYIYEDYQKYISIFYEGKLTRNDFTFRNNIVYGKKPNFEYSLNNPADIVDLLDENSFSQAAILNFDLFEYLISEKHPFLNQSCIILDNSPELLIEFIDKLESSKSIDISSMLEILVCSRSNFLELSKNYTDKFGDWCFKLCKNKNFFSVDLNHYLYLTKYLNESAKTVVEIASEPKELKKVILDNIISLNPLFELVEFNHKNDEQCEVYKTLYKERCIRVTSTSLHSYFNCVHKDEDFSLAFILEAKDELLIESIADTDILQQLVEKYWIETTKEGIEDENSIIHMLKSDITFEIKEQLISSIPFQLKHITSSKLDNITHLELSRQDKVIPSVENLVTIFTYTDQDDDHFEDFNIEADRVVSANLEGLLLAVRNLDNVDLLFDFTGIILFNIGKQYTFQSLVHPLSKHIDGYDLDNLTDEKYEYLIKERLVTYSDKLKSELEEDRPELLPLLISYNKDKFLETNQFYDLSDETLCSIAKLEVLSNAEILTIFESLSESSFFYSDELASCFADLLIIQPSDEVSEKLFGHLVEHVEPNSKKGQALIHAMHDKFDPIYLIENMTFDCIPYFSLEDKIHIFESSEVSDENKLLAIASLSDEEFKSPKIDTIYLSSLACKMQFDGVREANMINLASELDTDYNLIKLLSCQIDLLSEGGLKEICAFSTEHISNINTAKTHFELPNTEDYDLFSSLIKDKKLVKRKSTTKKDKIRVDLNNS